MSSVFHEFPKKDPDSVLRYTSDWTDWLNGDTIATSNVVVATGDVVVDSFSDDGSIVTFTLSAGTADTNSQVRVEVTTAGGETDHRTYIVPIKDR